MIYILLWFLNINILTRYLYNIEKDNIFIPYYFHVRTIAAYQIAQYLLHFYFYTTTFTKKHFRNPWPSDFERRFASSYIDLEF